MDILSYYYFTELCKDMNMSRTAERLYVSQQTISNHIQRMEEHYGTQLFYRKPSLSLTYAGEYAQRLLVDEQNLEDFLCDVEKREIGLLRFGASPLRLYDFLPSVLPSFAERYPEIELHITSAFSSLLEPMVLEGKLDLAITLDDDSKDSALIREPLASDQVFLCVPDRLLSGKKDRAWKEKLLQGAEVTDCADIPLALTDNRMGGVILQAFRDAGAEPKTYFTSSDSNLAFSVCSAGLAGAFVGHNRLVRAGDSLPPDLNIFPLLLDGRFAVQELSFVRRKDRYLPVYTRFLMELFRRRVQEMDLVRMERIV